MHSRTRRIENLTVSVHPDRTAMGRAAAALARETIAAAQAARGIARVVFACAPSQDEFLAALVNGEPGPDWARVEVFHLDEYVGMDAASPASFRNYLQRHLLDQIPATYAFHPLRGEAPDPAAECARYAALLEAGPLDLVCLGFGENGHLAFNDPPVADFADPAQVKVVELDEACRRQQVNDGCFPQLAAVPTHALTLTLSAIQRAQVIIGVVPGPRKAAAVKAALLGPITTACPASILRRHRATHLHLDDAAASLLT